MTMQHTVEKKGKKAATKFNELGGLSHFILNDIKLAYMIKSCIT